MPGPRVLARLVLASGSLQGLNRCVDARQEHILASPVGPLDCGSQGESRCTSDGAPDCQDFKQQYRHFTCPFSCTRPSNFRALKRKNVQNGLRAGR